MVMDWQLGIGRVERQPFPAYSRAMTPGSFPILFVTATRIGDAVLSSGLIRRLAIEIPQARFTIVAGPVAAPLFKDMPNLEELILFEKTKDGRHWWRLWQQVRRRQWGLVVDLRGSALSRFLKTRRKAVFKRPSGLPVHKVVEAAGVLRVEASEAPPYLYTSEETEAGALGIIQGEGPILALAPAANWVGKTWPVERFAQVAIQLMSEGGPFHGGRLMVLGGPDDIHMVQSLRHVVSKDRFIDLVGKVDLLTAHAALRHVRLFIGNDSGLMHLAAAAEIPTLGLFGPSDEALYAPWGDQTRVVRGPRSFEQIRATDPGFQQALCHMMDLPLETVLVAARELLAATE